MTIKLSINKLAEEIVSAIRDVTRTTETLTLHEPTLDETDVESVANCVRSGWVSSVGKEITEFERELSKFTGAPHVVAVGTGTAAIHTALNLLGIGSGDEVLIPALSFVATANAVVYTGATPHFVDVEEQTYGIDPVALKKYLRSVGAPSSDGLINKNTRKKIRACIPMHCFGHPVRMDELKNVCDEFGILAIEDAAEGIGSYYKGKHVGRLGKIGTLSFNGNKIITTGGGGALMFEDEDLAKRAKHISTTAKKPHAFAFEHDEVGYNYRLPNLNAALGLSQMRKLPSLLERKRRLAEKYQTRFKGSAVSFKTEPANTKSNYWLNTIAVPVKSVAERDELIGVLHRAGIQARPVWKLLSDLSMFLENPAADLAVATELEKKLINIPSSPRLADL